EWALLTNRVWSGALGVLFQPFPYWQIAVKPWLKSVVPVMTPPAEIPQTWVKEEFAMSMLLKVPFAYIKLTGNPMEGYATPMITPALLMPRRVVPLPPG